jgi:Uma2 family endonuclease
MTATTKLLTAEDLARIPSDEPWELWEGELVKVPGAGALASSVAAFVGWSISRFARANRLGRVTGADGAYVFARNPDTVIVPDAAFVRLERLPGGRLPIGYGPEPPDLAVEVVPAPEWAPPGHPNIAAKLVRYRRAGVPLLWCAYLDRNLVAVYLKGKLVAELGEADELDGGDVLPGFRLPVAEIFAEL